VFSWGYSGTPGCECIKRTDHCFRHGTITHVPRRGDSIVILNFLLLVDARVVGYVPLWMFVFVRTRVLEFVPDSLF
jgi:hypothetical protein